MNKISKVAKKVGTGVVAVFAMALLASSFVVSPAANAAGGCDDKSAAQGGLTSGVSAECSQGKGQATKLLGDGGIVNTIINTMLFIVGILSVVMIIFSGIRYVTAHGDKAQVESAKNTLIYAVVGLIISIVAYALVTWITGLWGDNVKS